jgi:hypothetical protein
MMDFWIHGRSNYGIPVVYIITLSSGLLDLVRLDLFFLSLLIYDCSTGQGIKLRSTRKLNRKVQSGA